MHALLIVDAQQDRCEGGAMALVGAESALAVMHRVAPAFALRFAAGDWHPSQSAHFSDWPPHCIANTEGAALCAALQGVAFTAQLRKGEDPEDAGYSAFSAGDGELELLLRQHRVQTLYLAGLGTEEGVLPTLREAVARGFDVCVIVDALAHHRPEPAPGEAHILQRIVDAGGRLVHSGALGGGD